MDEYVKCPDCKGTATFSQVDGIVDCKSDTCQMKRFKSAYKITSYDDGVTPQIVRILHPLYSL